MVSTPIYTFTTPELGSTADGPLAMATLASRVEREMTTLRGCTRYEQEPNAAYNSNQTVTIHSVTATVSVIGFLDIACTANLSGQGAISFDGAGGPTFSGELQLFADGVQINKSRFHALWGTRTLNLHITGKVANTAAQNSRVLQLRMSLENGANVFVNNTAMNVCQIGAPGTG